MREELENLNKKLTPYYSFLIMIGFFITLFIGAYQFFISPSDLRIIIEDENINYPSSIGNTYGKINEYLINNDTLEREATYIYDFLLQTTNKRKIIIKNTSTKTLKGIKIRQININELTASSISSNFMNSKEDKSFLENLDFDKERNIFFLKTPLELPPNSQITIEIWGNFLPDIINNNLIITYDEGEAHIEKEYTISGLKGYFLYHSIELIAIILFIFFIVYYVGINNLKNDTSN